MTRRGHFLLFYRERQENNCRGQHNLRDYPENPLLAQFFAGMYPLMESLQRYQWLPADLKIGKLKCVRKHSGGGPDKNHSPAIARKYPKREPVSKNKIEQYF